MPDPIQDRLDDITVPPGASEQEGRRRLAEEAESLAEAKQRVEIHVALRKERRQERQHKIDVRQRRDYANRLYCLAVAWLIAVLAVLTLAGFHGWHGMIRGKFYLSDSVLIAVVSGLTVNVLGIFITVVRHLFPRRDQAEDVNGK